MATINSLNISITQMSFQEALQRILEIRKSRKIPKKVVKEKKAPKEPSVPKAKTTKDPFVLLTKEQKLALIKQLGG